MSRMGDVIGIDVIGIDDTAIAQRHDAPRVAHGRLFVRDHHDRLCIAGQVSEQLEQAVRGARIEIARRLVRQQDRRFVRECAGDRDALLLSAGQLEGNLSACSTMPSRSSSSSARGRRSRNGQR